MSRRYDEHVIIKTLDNAPRVLFWDLDEFLLMFVPLFLGVALGSLILMASGFCLKPSYSRYRRRYRRGSLQHKFYWNLPHNAIERFGGIKTLPPSHIREMIL